MLDALVEKAPEVGIVEIVIGMAHRGRLNVLANILDKPYQEIFAEFEDNFLPDSADGDGDVKYHLGFSSDRTTAKGQHDSPVADAQSQPPGGGRIRSSKGRTRAKQRHSATTRSGAGTFRS